MRLMIVAILSVLLIGIAIVQPNCKIKDDYFGTTTKEELDRIIGYLADGDKEAFEAPIEQGILDGTVRILHKGDLVYLEGCDGWLCSTPKIRYPGERTIYWTVAEAVYCGSSKGS